MYQETYKNKKNIHVRKKDRSLSLYIVFSIAMILMYTVAEFIVSSRTGNTHDTLTTCFYACFGGEILACALIKVFKLKGEQRSE